jgi:hypothetical protein
VEGAGIEQAIDAFSHRQLSTGTLTVDLLLSAHFASELRTLSQLVDFRLPSHQRGR